VGLLESFFVIFIGASLLATLALFTRQPLLVAYIVTGCLLGPSGLGWVADPEMAHEMAEFGIIFLLFLVGLDMPPSKLRNMVGTTTITAIGSAAVFFAVGFAVMRAFDFTVVEAAVAGIACMFSSTIIGIKLLPTTVLHHRHIGEIVVGLLLLQDLIAILALICLSGFAEGTASAVSSLGRVLLTLPLVVGAAILAVRYAVLPLMHKFDAFLEFIFLSAIGWCLALALVAQYAGLSMEIGAFIAGVSLATSPIALYIASSLRPLRDFFLVLFFFSVGASFDLGILAEVALPAVVLGVTMVAIKPPTFRALLGFGGDEPATAWEAGFRLGQTSEFSLLVVYLATSLALVGREASHVIQGATVLTFLLSTYLVIFRYPSPIAVTAALRRD
jgi:Kef-type K+ transport system membrane component KefB